MRTGWHATCSTPFYQIGADLYIWREENGRIFQAVWADPPMMKTVEPSEPGSPSLRLMDDMLPALMQGLHEHGVRPPSLSYTEGQLAATLKHLDDMRRLVRPRWSR